MIHRPPINTQEGGQTGDSDTGAEPEPVPSPTAGDQAHSDPAGLPAATQPLPVLPPRWSRRRLMIGAAVATALVVAGASGWYVLRGRDQTNQSARTPTTSASQDTRYVDTLQATTRRLNALVDRRSRAVVERDRAAFLAGLDPSKKKLIDQQKSIFRNLMALPVAKHDFKTGYTDLPKPYDLDDLGGTWDTGSAVMTELVQLRDVDQEATEAQYTWELTVRGGKLLITDISPNKTDGSYAPAPWDGSALTVVRTRHMIVAATPDAARRARQVASAAESAYSHSKRYWRKNPASEFVIFATAKGSTFRRWYGKDDEFGEGEAVAKAIDVPSCCSNKRDLLGDVTSLRIIIDTSEHPDEIDLEWTLAHELTHAVAEPLAPLSNDVMVWADEGYAEFVGVKMLESRGYVTDWASVARKAANRKSFNNKLPADDDFYGKNADANYALSVRFFDFLASRYGTTKTRDFYFYLNGMEFPNANAAMRKYFKTSETKLVAAWADWVG
jgi:hypothetical protein